MGDRVHRYLVTARTEPRIDLWLVTGVYANWIEGRANPEPGDGIGRYRQTWLVTVPADHADHFLAAARTVAGVTVEQIEGSGDTETYTLRVGEPGTGWKPPS